MAMNGFQPVDGLKTTLRHKMSSASTVNLEWVSPAQTGNGAQIGAISIENVLVELEERWRLFEADDRRLPVEDDLRGRHLVLISDAAAATPADVVRRILRVGRLRSFGAAPLAQFDGSLAGDLVERIVLHFRMRRHFLIGGWSRDPIFFFDDQTRNSLTNSWFLCANRVNCIWLWPTTRLELSRPTCGRVLSDRQRQRHLPQAPPPFPWPWIFFCSHLDVVCVCDHFSERLSPQSQCQASSLVFVWKKFKITWCLVTSWRAS